MELLVFMLIPRTLKTALFMFKSRFAEQKILDIMSRIFS